MGVQEVATTIGNAMILMTGDWSLTMLILAGCMLYIMNLTGFRRGSIALVGILALALWYMIGIVPMAALYLVVVMAAIITAVALFKLVRQ